jgi:NAD(P)-dependent dehydrogenase (short-subunit alcohol dehydrogenase family)
MDHKVALITGSTRGIGFGIAKALAKEGYNLVINGVRDESKLGTRLSELRSSGIEAIYCRGDIGCSEDRKSIVEKAKEHYGRLNILVNNAGIAPGKRSDILVATEEDYEKVLKTNLQGSYFMTQIVANWMIQQKKADPDFNSCIINISSISATVASVSRGEYCISKAGISMSTQLFAVRLGEFNIPVYEIRPGVISTDMTSGVREKYDSLIENGLSLQRRWGMPDDVGKVVSAIAAGNFAYSTGQVFMVDGGLTVPRL